MSAIFGVEAETMDSDCCLEHAGRTPEDPSLFSSGGAHLPHKHGIGYKTKREFFVATFRVERLTLQPSKLWWMSPPTVTRVTFDLPECKQPQKKEKKRNQDCSALSFPAPRLQGHCRQACPSGKVESMVSHCVTVARPFATPWSQTLILLRCAFFPQALCLRAFSLSLSLFSRQPGRPGLEMELRQNLQPHASLSPSRSCLNTRPDHCGP